MIYDDLDQHLPAAGSIDRAATPLGMYLAWCVNMQLVSHALPEVAERLLLRVRYREITGAELLVGGCGGVLSAEHLSSAGRRFTDAYYARFMDDFREVFGDAIYDVPDRWDQYDKLAPVLTKRYLGPAGGNAPHHWWQFWK